MKKGFIVFLALIILFITACCAGEGADHLTCAVYPLLPDPAYDQELIERRRAQIEPDLPLVRAEWMLYGRRAAVPPAAPEKPLSHSVRTLSPLRPAGSAGSGRKQPRHPDALT